MAGGGGITYRRGSRRRRPRDVLGWGILAPSGSSSSSSSRPANRAKKKASKETFAFARRCKALRKANTQRFFSHPERGVVFLSFSSRSLFSALLPRHSALPAFLSAVKMHGFFGFSYYKLSAYTRRMRGSASFESAQSASLSLTQ